MGIAHTKAENLDNNSVTDQLKITIVLEVNVHKMVHVHLLQLTNWSFEQIKNSLQVFQRLSELPIMDSFLFHRMMPFNKKNCDIMYSLLSKGQKYISVYELVCMLVLASFNTFVRKFHFLQLVFDFGHRGRIYGRQFILLYYSMLYEYCRLTGHDLPDHSTVQKFVKAVLFPGEQQNQYIDKQITLRRGIQEYQTNQKIADLFNRFEHAEVHHVKQNYTTFNKSQFKKYSDAQINKIYTILTGLYLGNRCEEVSLIEENRQLRIKNRRDQCQRLIMQEKQGVGSVKSIKLSPIKRKSLNQVQTQTPSRSQSEFKSRKLKSINPRQSFSPSKKKTLIFLQGKTCSKKQIMESISYFKSLSDGGDTVSIKDFFKKFEKKLFLKKQVGSIFRYLDAKNQREVSITQYFKSLYPGVTAEDLDLLHKWYELYQEVYEADSLVRNQVKMVEMKDARVLPPSTLDRIKEIFSAMDHGNKGFINFDDLRKAYKRGFTLDELEQLLKEYGSNNVLGLKGLCRMLLPVGWQIEGVDLQNL